MKTVKQPVAADVTSDDGRTDDPLAAARRFLAELEARRKAAE